MAYQITFATKEDSVLVVTEGEEGEVTLKTGNPGHLVTLRPGQVATLRTWMLSLQAPGRQKGEEQFG